MNDQGLVALAAQHSLPPSLVWALAVTAEDKSDAHLESLAKLTSGAFQRTRTWEGALSAALTGDPGTVENSSNPDAGRVLAALGIAASRPEWGMQGYHPADFKVFAGGAKAMARSAGQLARLGGAVIPQHVQSWAQAITSVKHPAPSQGPASAATSPTSGPIPTAPPDIAQAQAVGKFASELQQMGITPDHFKQIFPVLAQTYRRLLGRSPEIHDIASHKGQTPDQIVESVRAMPAPGYPDHTAGQMMDMWNTARLYSTGLHRRTPFSSEISGFLGAKMTHRDVHEYYKAMSKGFVEDEQKSEVVHRSPSQVPTKDKPPKKQEEQHG